ncbi:MAG: hypothetical protein PHG64_13705 [Paludibacter sp.]|nr:hypothetical protein [Paludibacter sp.]
MDDIFIKGTAFGFTSDKWCNDTEILPSMLLSVLKTWNVKTFDGRENLIIDISDDLAREYGKINAATAGFGSDLHNLSINYSMIERIRNDESLNNGYKSIYISLLVENFITNIRSCYDFTSLFPRLFLDLKDIKRLTSMKNSDSLNTLLKFCKKESGANIFPDSIYGPLNKVKSDLDDIKSIRDSIVHHGKEPIIHIEDNKLFLKIPKSAPNWDENALPDLLSLGSDDYPLFAYLRELTIRLINYTEDLGHVMLGEFVKNDSKFNVFLTGLIGVCISNFRAFITSDEVR